MDDIDDRNIIQGKRTRKSPRTYWEEYVETDTWYTHKLLEDVPSAEMWAAVHDEDLSADDDMEEEEAGESTDDDEIIPSVDGDYETSRASESIGSSDSDSCDGEEDEEVSWTSERE